ncbi:MAG: EAL domain-containing protein [Devosia sp.]|uniref:EAL domain-containing protein n=1 Tax=Devosia sp. TaxID=1871048 RepID=UPI003392CBDE
MTSRPYRFDSVQTIIDAVPNPIFAKDRSHQIVMANESACAFFGYSRSTLLNCSDLELFPAEQVRVFHAADERVFETGEEWENEEQITDGTGRVRHVITRKRMARLYGIEYLVASVTDISPFREAEAEIRHLAFHDPLTGLANRRRFEEQLGSCLQEVDTEKQIAILLLDLDGFKAVNDTHGHAVGDRTLKAFCEKVSAILPSDHCFARVGGDEFAIIIRANSSHEAQEVAYRIIEALAEPFVVDELGIVLGVGIGIVLSPDDGRHPDDLLRRADRALYRAKALGRSTVRHFEADIDLVSEHRDQLKHELREAIASGNIIVPYYQPIVSLDDGRILGFEALARWESENLGQVPPDVFIPIAEQDGLISTLSSRLFDQACRDAAAWPEPLTLAFNISPASLRDHTLGLRILAQLAQSGLRPSRLELEITESALVDNLRIAQDTINLLRQAGIRIALDDFGTGYATLSQLMSFHPDKIKIDRSFVSRLEENEEAREIVRAILGLARGLGLSTTAEGVERPQQLEYLRTNGCSGGQGHLFCRAIPAAEVPSFLSLYTRSSLNRSAAIS